MNNRKHENMPGSSSSEMEMLFQRAAKEYTERYGAEVKRELTGLSESGVAYAAPGLDWQVRKQTVRLKQRRWFRVAALTAACLILLMATPAIWKMTNLTDSPPSSSRAASSAAAPTASSAPSAVAVPPLANISPGDLQPEPRLIPLSFMLPENFQVETAKIDNGQSVYYLSNTGRDDVVMTLEASEEGVFTEGLKQIDLNGTVTYGLTEADYCLLTFEKEDIVYVLTCKHDINTLLSLGKSILI